MKTKKQRAQSTALVRRTRGDDVGIKLALRFNPKSIGEGRAQAIYKGIAEIVAAILTPEEQAEFMRQFEAAKNSAADRAAKTKSAARRSRATAARKGGAR